MTRCPGSQMLVTHIMQKSDSSVGWFGLLINDYCHVIIKELHVS